MKPSGRIRRADADVVGVVIVNVVAGYGPRTSTTDEVVNNGLQARPRAAAVLKFKRAIFVADAVAALAGGGAEIHVGIRASGTAEEGVAKYCEPIDTQASIFHLVGGADIDGCGDVVAGRRGGRFAPRVCNADGNSADDKGYEDERDGAHMHAYIVHDAPVDLGCRSVIGDIHTINALLLLVCRRDVHLDALLYCTGRCAINTLAAEREGGLGVDGIGYSAGR